MSENPQGQYLALCPNYWGKGETIEEAKRQMKAHGGKLTQYVVYQLPPGVTEVDVDPFGQIRWKWPKGYQGKRHGVDLPIVAKRGVKA
jgi:hypothetical protein